MGQSISKIGGNTLADIKFREQVKKLDSKVDLFDSQIKKIEKEKMDKDTTDISISQINPNKGKINQNYISNELLQQIAGNAPINLVPKRNSILLEHESWLNVVKLNLVDPNVTTPDTIMNANGTTSHNTDYICSDFIEVEEGKQYFNNSSLSGAFFDEQKKYVSGLNAGFSNPFTVPNGVKYVRLTYSSSSSSNILCEGDRILNTNANYGDMQVKFNNTDFENLLTEFINNTSIENTEWLYLRNSLNLYNEDNATLGKYIVHTNGYTADDTNWKASEYIAIKPNTTYIKNNTSGYAFYSSNKASSYISGGTESIMTSPSNANFIRVSVKSSSSTFMLVEGDILPSTYEAYGQKSLDLKDTYKESFMNIVGKKTLPTENKNFLIFGDSITETATVSDDGATYTEGTNTNWVTYSKQTLKMGELYNYAKAGASYKDRDGVLERQKISHQITTAIANNRPADIIIISAGTNDWQRDLGDYDTAMSKKTLDDLDRTNLYEAIRWAFWTLRKNYPEAICFVATPIQRADANPFTKTIQAIIEMAERYNFVVIPAHKESGIVKDFEVIDGQGRYLYDGLHPDTNGKKLMSKYYNSVILNYLQNYN